MNCTNIGIAFTTSESRPRLPNSSKIFAACKIPTLRQVLTTVSLVWIVAAFLPRAAAADEHWPQWRGPNFDGSSKTANPPIRWNEDENVRWKLEIPGRGGSTPIVWGDRLYILTAIPIETTAAEEGADDAAAADTARNRARQAPAADESSGRQRPGPQARGDRGGRGGPPGGFGRRGFGRGPSRPMQMMQFAVLAYDRHSGDEVWRTVATEQVPHEPGHGTNTFASSSPVTDGKHLYVNFGSRGVYCLDLDGNVLWNQDLGQMRTRAQFGEASSPALHDGRLVIPWDHEGQSQLIALDAETGKTLWSTDRDEATTWATPLIAEYDGVTQVITNGTTVRSYSLENGEMLWQAGGQVENPIPSPVRVDDFVVAMTGYRGNAAYAIRLDARGDARESGAVVWSRTDAAPYVASPTLWDDRLYFTKSRDGILSSVDARTGEAVISQQRLPGIRSIYASPVAAADRIYVTGREGTTVVLKHGPTFEVLATNQLDDTLDASPVMIGDVMYLRGEKYLYCIAESAE